MAVARSGDGHSNEAVCGCCSRSLLIMKDAASNQVPGWPASSAACDSPRWFGPGVEGLG